MCLASFTVSVSVRPDLVFLQSYIFFEIRQKVKDRQNEGGKGLKREDRSGGWKTAEENSI